AVFEADDEHAGEFETLCRVQRQQRNALGARVPEIDAARERDSIAETRLVVAAALGKRQQALQREVARRALAFLGCEASRAFSQWSGETSFGRGHRQRIEQRAGIRLTRKRDMGELAKRDAGTGEGLAQWRGLRLGPVQHGEVGERELGLPPADAAAVDREE